MSETVAQLWRDKADYMLQTMEGRDRRQDIGTNTVLAWAEAEYRIEHRLFSGLDTTQKLGIAQRAGVWYEENGHEVPENYVEYCDLLREHLES